MHYYIRSERDGVIHKDGEASEYSHYKAGKAYPILRGNKFEESDGVLSKGFVDIDGNMYQVQNTDNGFKVHKGKEVKDPVLIDWGAVVTKSNVCLYYLHSQEIKDRELCDWLRYDVLGIHVNIGKHNLGDRLDCLNPFRSEKFIGKISISKSHEDRIRDRETALKVGKAFKAIFPELDGAALDKVVDAYHDKFSGGDLTLHTSKCPKVFASVYKESNHAPYKNPKTTSMRKSIACSCMRYEFDNQDYHPAYVYGSGDFTLYYTTDSQGRTGSRCVVYDTDKTDKPQAGPIYGVCEGSMDLIKNELDKIDAEYSNPSWLGANLLHIKFNDGVIGPYLDLEPRSLAIVNDQYLEVSGSGDIDASCYSGVLGDSYRCCGCGCSVDEDDVRTYGDDEYCEDCFYEYYGYCEWSDDYYPNEDLVNIQPHDVYVWIDCDNVVQCTDGEYWDAEHAYYVEAEDKWISEDTYAEDGYFTSEWDDQIYPEKMLAMTTAGEAVSEGEALDAGYVMNDDGQWCDLDEIEEEKGDEE